MSYNNTPAVTMSNRIIQSKNTPFEFSYRETAKYKFITYDVIPEGIYLSTIKHIIDSHTCSGNSAIDICYDMLELNDYIAFVRGKISEEKIRIYYVKERIPLTSQVMDSFIDMLYNEYGFEGTFQKDALIGLEEHMKIRYTENRRFGEIHDRFDWTREDEEDYIHYMEEQDAKHLHVYNPYD